jgi:uncharacterized protein with von Willebrand factor type A (vWA) domain
MFTFSLILDRVMCMIGLTYSLKFNDVNHSMFSHLMPKETLVLTFKPKQSSTLFLLYRYCIYFTVLTDTT